MAFSKKDVKSNLLDHSAAKVQLLSAYLKRYLSIISNDGYTRQIHLYDLFCGRGIYENDGKGSPIVALEQIKETHEMVVERRGKGWPAINCNFNDIDNATIINLGEAIEEHALYDKKFGTLDLTCNDYKDEIERLKQLFKGFGSEKAFVFIDPYGYKEVKAEHIKGLMDCKKAEVLLWLPIQFMYRFIDAGTPGALESFINELGIKGEVKKAEQAKNVWNFIHILKNGFQNYLGAKFFVDSFTLRKEENTVFCLFFFTSHIKGFEKMMESKWEIDTDQGRGWEYNGSQPSLFSGFQSNELEEKLKVYLKSRQCWNSDVYEFTLREGYLPTHSTQILIDWQRRGICDVLDPNGLPARKRSIYLNYDCYSNQPQKVFFKLK